MPGKRYRVWRDRVEQADKSELRDLFDWYMEKLRNAAGMDVIEEVYFAANVGPNGEYRGSPAGGHRVFHVGPDEEPPDELQSWDVTFAMEPSRTVSYDLIREEAIDAARAAE